VFLAGNRAYKLKKPLDLGFLDFSDPSVRAATCRDEVRLNRRLAPEVYLGVSPVWLEEPDRVRVGEPVEVPPPCDELLVVMKRLPDERMLDRLLEERGVTAADVERLARIVAGFHATAAHGPDVSRYGARGEIKSIVDANLLQTERHCGELFDAHGQRLMRERLHGFLENRDFLFERRVRDQRIRDVHGDLHAENVCLPEAGGPVIYDCLEFARRLRCTDVAAEVAFLSMDLEARGRPDLASCFVDAYVGVAGDAGLRQLLPFYHCSRAIVRAKVIALRAEASGPSPAELEARRRDARARHRLAVRYSEGLLPRSLVVLSGLPGTGKTSVSESLFVRTGIEPLETDRVRKRLAGLDPDRDARAAPREGIYTEAMTGATYRALLRHARERLTAGEGVTLVGTFLKREQRAAVADIAASAGVELLIVELVASETTVLERIAARGEGSSDADEAVYHWLRDAREPFDDVAPGSRVSLDTSGRGPGELAELILERLRRPFDREAG